MIRFIILSLTTKNQELFYLKSLFNAAALFHLHYELLCQIVIMLCGIVAI